MIQQLQTESTLRLASAEENREGEVIWVNHSSGCNQCGVNLFGRPPNSTDKTIVEEWLRTTDELSAPIDAKLILIESTDSIADLLSPMQT